MKWFNKKDKQEEPKDDGTNIKTNKKTTKAMFNVVIKEKFGIATTTLKTIKAERFIDPDDYVVYLMNTQESFIELFPQDENDFEKLDRKTIEKKLEQSRAQYKKELEKDDPETNDKNILFDIMKYEAQLRALQYNRNSAYMTIDENGVKTFYFLREGSTFYPMKWDTDNRTVYVASENKKKKAGIARRNKNIKYSKFKNVIEGSVMFIMILNVIFAIALGYSTLKLFTKFDESKIVEAQNYCVQKGAEWTAIVEKNAKATENIINNINENIESSKNPLVDQFIPTTVNSGG